MADDFSKTYERLQRKFFRESIHRIWNMAKSGQLDEISEQDHKLAVIIMDHQEYCDHFEDTDILDGREYEAGNEVNPFLHISLHQMVEDQLASNSPLEAAFFCETLKDRGISHHEAVHYIIMILIRIIYDSMMNQKHFDIDRYKRLLTACGNVEPSEIPDVIDWDFSSN